MGCEGLHLGIELSQEVKVLLEVGGEDGLDDEEAESFELHVAQVAQEVVLGVRQEEVPGGSSVVVLQDGAVVVQNGLHRGGREGGLGMERDAHSEHTVEKTTTHTATHTHVTHDSELLTQKHTEVKLSKCLPIYCTSESWHYERELMPINLRKCYRCRQSVLTVRELRVS